MSRTPSGVRGRAVARSGLALAAVLAAGAVLAAPRPEAATRPSDAPAFRLKGVVDPYNPVTERSRFFKAAGVDNELSAEEFAASAGAEASFVRPFDRWEKLLRFDRNANKTIDWFEADAYRRALRKTVLKHCDRNSDRRLRGQERQAARAFLATGGRTGDDTSAGAVETPESLIDEYDTDGDGKLSPAERMAAARAVRDGWRRDRLARYDTDGDGELSKDERAAMREDLRRRSTGWAEGIEQWKRRHFDADGDGELSQAEQAEARAFMKDVRGIFGDLRKRQMDRDGDGNVSEQERKLARQEQQVVGAFVALRSVGYLDADGDGTISAAERESFMTEFRGKVLNWFENYTAGFDADADGRLAKPERGALLRGLREDVRRRTRDADADADGHLQPKETLQFIERFMQDIGLRPARQTPPAGDPAAPAGDGETEPDRPAPGDSD